MGLDDDSTLAGWHRDPSGRHELRFWNGDRWTEHIIDDGIPGLDAPTRSGRTPAAAAPTPPPPPPQAGGHAPLEVDPPTEVPEAEVVEAAEVDHHDVDIVELEAAEAAEVVEADVTAEADREPAMSMTSRRTDARVGSATAPEQSRPRAAEPSPGVRGRITPPTDQPFIVEPKAGPATEPEPVVEPHASVEPEPVVEPEPIVEPEPEPVAVVEPEPIPEPVSEPPAATGHLAVSGRDANPRAVMVGPSVASPTGNSAGSNTSAIADPHVAGGAANPQERIDAPRVAGVSPVPVKRYRPGSPPPSPFARQPALPASSGPIGTVVKAWYRRPLVWVVMALVAALIGGAVFVATNRSTGNTARAPLNGRAPAGAPRGSKVIDGDGFGIAAPIGWFTTSDPGRTFPQLKRTNWTTPLAAIKPGTSEGLLVVSLHDLAHSPQVDPDRFWTDQVVGPGAEHPITPGPPLGVHGFRANRVSISDLSGTVMVAAAIDTGDHTYLVAFTGPDSATANDRFERLIQTFDAR